MGFKQPAWIRRLALLSPIYRFASRQKYGKHGKDFFKTHIRKLANYCSNISAYQEFLAYIYGIVVYSNIPSYKILNGIGEEYESGLFEATNKSNIQKHIDDIDYLYNTPITESIRKSFGEDPDRWRILLVLFFLDAVLNMEEDLHNYLHGTEESVVNDLQKLYFSWIKLGTTAGWFKEKE